MLKDKIQKLMDEKNINKSELSKGAGIPYTTIDGLFKKNSENVKLPTLKKLATYFNCTLDFLVDDDSDKSFENQQFATAEEAMQYIIKMPVVSAYGGYDLERMSDEEIIKLANQLTGVFKMLAEEYKDK